MTPEQITAVAKRMGWLQTYRLTWDLADLSERMVEGGSFTDSGIVAMLEWALANEFCIYQMLGKYWLLKGHVSEGTRLAFNADTLADALALAIMGDAT